MPDVSVVAGVVVVVVEGVGQIGREITIAERLARGQLSVPEH